MALSSRRRTTDKNNGSGDRVRRQVTRCRPSQQGPVVGGHDAVVRPRNCPTTYRSPDSPVRQMTADNRPLAFRRRHRQNKHICDFELASGRRPLTEWTENPVDYSRRPTAIYAIGASHRYVIVRLDTMSCGSAVVSLFPDMTVVCRLPSVHFSHSETLISPRQ